MVADHVAKPKLFRNHAGESQPRMGRKRHVHHIVIIVIIMWMFGLSWMELDLTQGHWPSS